MKGKSGHEGRKDVGKRLRVFAVLAVILAPMIVRTTPPIPPPCDEFTMRGNVVSTGGLSVKGYAIVAIYQTRQWPDSFLVWPLTRPEIVLSDHEGRFSIRGTDCDLGVQRLAAAVLEGNTIGATSDTVDVSTLDFDEKWRAVTTPTTDSCCQETAEQPILAGYAYHVPELIITVP